MNFSDIVGQESIKEQLQGAISTGRVSHAYILYGEVRSGKEFVAKVFAQSLLCKVKTTEDITTLYTGGISTYNEYTLYDGTMSKQ